MPVSFDEVYSQLAKWSMGHSLAVMDMGMGMIIRKVTIVMSIHHTLEWSGVQRSER